MALKSKAAVAAPSDAPQDNPAKGNAEARDLVDKSLEIARLEAQIAREHQAYQQRPKKKFVGARTSEYRFAQYIDNFRAKIERIGTLNYPDEARARKIYASLQLTVGIRADGEVESIEVNRSSDTNSSTRRRSASFASRRRSRRSPPKSAAIRTSSTSRAPGPSRSPTR